MFSSFFDLWPLCFSFGHPTDRPTDKEANLRKRLSSSFICHHYSWIEDGFADGSTHRPTEKRNPQINSTGENETPRVDFWYKRTIPVESGPPNVFLASSLSWLE